MDCQADAAQLPLAEKSNHPNSNQAKNNATATATLTTRQLRMCVCVFCVCWCVCNANDIFVPFHSARSAHFSHIFAKLFLETCTWGMTASALSLSLSLLLLLLALETVNWVLFLMMFRRDRDAFWSPRWAFFFFYFSCSLTSANREPTIIYLKFEGCFPWLMFHTLSRAWSLFYFCS